MQSDLNKKGCQQSQVYKVDFGVKSVLKGVHASSLLHPSLHFHQNLDFRRTEMQILHLPLTHSRHATNLSDLHFHTEQSRESIQPTALLQSSNVMCPGR